MTDNEIVADLERQHNNMTDNEIIADLKRQLNGSARRELAYRIYELSQDVNQCLPSINEFVESLEEILERAKIYQGEQDNH